MWKNTQAASMIANDDAARWLAAAGLAIGALGVGIASASLPRRRHGSKQS
jgi:hypothetical protein